MEQDDEDVSDEDVSDELITERVVAYLRTADFWRQQPGGRSARGWGTN
jgi:hypothetical protein